MFSLNTNMLHFRVGFAKSLGPRITFFNETIVYTYPGGGYVDDPMQYVHVEIPQAMPFTLHWFAIPQAGLEPVRYRWVIDPNGSLRTRRRVRRPTISGTGAISTPSPR